MSLKMIKDGGRRTSVYYALSFDYVGEKNCGFSFDCDKDGKVFENNANSKNYRACLTGEVNGKNVQKPEIQRRECSWFESPIFLCTCGEEVQGSGPGRDFNCDKCGALYNSGGQELCSPRHWGEETGEHPADIARAFNSQDNPLDWEE